MNQNKIDKFESNVDYTTVLENFEGPLDLLLYLIKEAEIEVKDIFISKVTEQFMVYLNGLDTLDIDKASEYLFIAATIMEIKSRKLLPDPEPLLPEEDPEYLLKLQLEEYKLYKEASEKLKIYEDVNKFFKEPDKNVGQAKIIYKDFTLDGLIKAFSNLLMRVDQREASKLLQKEIPKDVFTVSEKIVYIQDRLLDEKTISFDSLFTKFSTKNEVVTTFQALLELLKLQFIHVEQNGVFDNILLTLREERNNNIEELN
jgi:segregation and condensation protein A